MVDPDRSDNCVSVVGLEIVQKVAPLRRVKPVNAALVSVLAGLWIATGELDHLVGQTLTKGGLSYSPSGLSGPFALTDHAETTDGWSFLGGSELGGWLVGYGLLDILLATTYTVILLRMLGCLRPSARVTTRITALVLTAGALDVIENLLIAVDVALASVLPVISTLKWLVLVGALVALVLAAKDRIRSWAANGYRAAYTHRYSVLIVLPISVLGIGRGPDILEQLPDIQRSWTDAGGFGDFAWAAFVTLILAGVCFVIGRQRTHHLWRRTRDESGDPNEGASVDRPQPMLLIWMLGPALLLVAAGVTNGLGADIGRVRLGAFCSVPVAVAGVSWCLRRRYDKRKRQNKPVPTQPERRPVDRDRFDAAAWFGDLMPPLLLVVAGLGSVRAFTGVLALGQLSWFGVSLLGAAAIALVATWFVWDGLLSRIETAGSHLTATGSADRRQRMLAVLVPGAQRAPGDDGSTVGLPAYASLVAGILGVVLVALLPVPLAQGAGVIATFQLALGSLSLLIAAIVILFQDGGAPEIFWPLRLPFVPVTTLVIASCAFAALAGGGSDVHGIRDYDERTVARPSLTDHFEDWLAATDDCGIDVAVEVAGAAHEVNLRPLVLYAAEGGGIRAAYWTTATLDQLVATAAAGDRQGGATCAQAFMSSGASGGSVGLSIASVSAPGEAAGATDQITGPAALAAATDGLVLRDPIFAATGVPFPSIGDGIDDRDEPWLDRGTLIEEAWEDPDGIPALDSPFLKAPSAWQDWGPTGALVVNSTSSTTACRALLSQVELEPTTSSKAGDCTPSGGAAGSTDLIDCIGQRRTTTAALLTARFPYVTPSGVVSCGVDTGARFAEQQIVDGGYAENTGIGTLVDVAPQWIDEVHAHNSCVVAQLSATDTEPGCAAGDATVVVPMLVYLDNGTGSDLVRQAGGLDLEIVVPPATLLSSKASLVSARSQLQRAEAAFAVDQLWDQGLSASEAVETAVAAWRTDAVYVAYQATEPSIAAPLGWVLSDVSICTMERSLDTDHQNRGFGFGRLSEFATIALGHEYVGAEPDHC